MSLRCVRMGPFIVAPFLAAPSSAQKLIPDELSCARCSIETRAVARLGGHLDSEVPSTLASAVLIDSANRIWVFYWDKMPLVFDRNGKLVRQFPRGSGPSEFTSPFMAFRIPGDSIVVVDSRNMRISVLARDFSVKRSVAYEHRLRYPVLVRWPDQVIMTGAVRSPDEPRPTGDGLESSPIHIVSLASNRLNISRSFGTREMLTRQQLMMGGGRPRTLSPAVRNGSIWEFQYARYDLVRHMLNGLFADTVRRRPAWFARESQSAGGPNQPPQPQLAEAFEDANGVLWTYVLVRAPTWREAWPKLAPGVHEIAMDQLKHEKQFHTVVEAIDLRTRRVLARRTIDAPVTAITDEGVAVFYRTTAADEIPYLELVRVQLAGR